MKRQIRRESPEEERLRKESEVHQPREQQEKKTDVVILPRKIRPQTQYEGLGTMTDRACIDD